MIDKKRMEEAQKNFKNYLEEGLLKKEHQNLAKEKYLTNANLSLKVAHELINSPSKPYL